MTLVILSVLGALASIASLILHLADSIGIWPVVAIASATSVTMAAAWRSAYLKSPVFCTSTTISLRFDESGELVPVRKIQTFMALRPHITRFEERVSSNENTTDFIATVHGLASTTRILEQTGSDTVYAQEFNRPLKPFKHYTREVNYTLKNCFLDASEWYEVAVLYPGARMRVELEFLRTRAPLAIVAYRRIGSISVHEDDVVPQAKGDGTIVGATVSIRWVLVGSKYRIEWSW